MLLEQPTIVLPPKATSFTVVCALCVQLGEASDYLDATVNGTLRLDADHGSAFCAHGHELRVERARAS